MKINDLLKTINEICKNIVKVYVVMSHTTTEEKCGMDFSPSSGEATSGEKKFPYESRVAEPRVTNREIYHATFLLSGGVP